MRTHPSVEYDFDDYEQLTREQKNYLASIANEAREMRYQQMQRHRCSPFAERGIRLTTLPAGSGVQEIIEQQGWQNFIRKRPGYDADLVREFYGCMHPATYCFRDTVVVRGVRVRISAQDICEYFGLIYKEHLIDSYGLSGNEIFDVPYNPDVAASLRINGYRHWDASQRYCLYKSDLHHELGFLTLFIKASLKPSRHNTTIDQQVAEVLYSLQHNLDIDAGQIIWLELLDAGVKLDGVLPFPCMITEFCMRAGLDADLCEPEESFSKKHMRIQITAHKKLNERRLASGEAWEREMAIRELPEEDDDDDDYVPPPPPYYQQMPQFNFPEGTPAYIDLMATQLAQHVNLGFGYVHERLDLYGVPQIDPPNPPAQAPRNQQPGAGPSNQGQRPRRRRDRSDEASGSGQNQPRANRAPRRR